MTVMIIFSQLLLGYMLDGPAVESTIVNGVEVLLSLLEIRRPAPQGGGFYPYTTEQVRSGAPQQEYHLVHCCRTRHPTRLT